MISDLATKWANQTVYISHAASTWDSQGNPVLPTPSANTALIQYVTKAVMDRNGTQKVSSCQILLSSTASVSIDDSITLPDGSNPEILSVERGTDFDGNQAYVKVYT